MVWRLTEVVHIIFRVDPGMVNCHGWGLSQLYWQCLFKVYLLLQFWSNDLQITPQHTSGKSLCGVCFFLHSLPKWLTASHFKFPFFPFKMHCENMNPQEQLYQAHTLTSANHIEAFSPPPPFTLCCHNFIYAQYYLFFFLFRGWGVLCNWILAGIFKHSNTFTINLEFIYFFFLVSCNWVKLKFFAFVMELVVLLSLKSGITYIYKM